MPSLNGAYRFLFLNDFINNSYCEENYGDRHMANGDKYERHIFHIKKFMALGPSAVDR